MLCEEWDAGTKEWRSSLKLTKITKKGILIFEIHSLDYYYITLLIEEEMQVTECSLIEGNSL